MNHPFFQAGISWEGGGIWELYPLDSHASRDIRAYITPMPDSCWVEPRLEICPVFSLGPVSGPERPLMAVEKKPHPKKPSWDFENIRAVNGPVRVAGSLPWLPTHAGILVLLASCSIEAHSS